MTTDFRALCAELADVLEGLFDEPEIPGEIRRSHSLGEHLTRARAALADEPAVPEGREPVSVTGQPSDEDLWNTADLVFQANLWPTDAIRYARAVLARWGNPAPQPPAEEEVAELTGKLVEAANGAAAMGWDQHARRILRAADLLQRPSPPQPVPVSERWPEFSDCDDADRVWCWSWAIGTWRLNRINRSIHSHWLPAHALPIPSVEKSK